MQAGGTNGPGPPTDQDLLDRVRRGDTAAFEPLYRRHADAAWRAALAILSNGNDAADAVADAFTKILRTAKHAGGARIVNFRAYLLTATRHAAIDRHRAREVATEIEIVVAASPSTSTDAVFERVVDLDDTEFAVRAFRQLPERWRRVLWLTEVLGLSPAEAAAHLEMNANAVAQLAFRARAGLRERFLATHLDPAAEGECGSVVDRLPAYTVGRASVKEREAVESHLAGCAACRRRRDELASVGARR